MTFQTNRERDVAQAAEPRSVFDYLVKGLKVTFTGAANNYAFTFAGRKFQLFSDADTTVAADTDYSASMGATGTVAAAASTLATLYNANKTYGAGSVATHDGTATTLIHAGVTDNAPEGIAFNAGDPVATSGDANVDFTALVENPYGVSEAGATFASDLAVVEFAHNLSSGEATADAFTVMAPVDLTGKQCYQAVVYVQGDSSLYTGMFTDILTAVPTGNLIAVTVTADSLNAGDRVFGKLLFSTAE